MEKQCTKCKVVKSINEFKIKVQKMVCDAIVENVITI